MCGRYASLLPAEAIVRIFGTVNPAAEPGTDAFHERMPRHRQEAGYVSLGPLVCLG